MEEEEEVGLADGPLPFPSLPRNVSTFGSHPWGRGISDHIHGDVALHTEIPVRAAKGPV